MSLQPKQNIFSVNFAKLVLYASSLGYEVSIREVQRHQIIQKLYLGNEVIVTGWKTFKQLPTSHAEYSFHLDAIGGDLLLFKDGKLVQDLKSYLPLGQYWEGLNEDNVWGGNWDRDENYGESANWEVDLVHFEFRG
jgi:hypothetical protein